MYFTRRQFGSNINLVERIAVIDEKSAESSNDSDSSSVDISKASSEDQNHLSYEDKIVVSKQDDKIMQQMPP